MHVLLSIHHPRPEHREALIASMHRYGAAISEHEGLVAIHTLGDERSDRLVGLAIFASREAFERLAPIARAAVADDPFDEWEHRDIDGLFLAEA